MGAIIAGCGFVARSFSGDPRQVRALLKAAFGHRGTALIDIISPCVTFNNRGDSPKSYSWGKAHQESLHELEYYPGDYVPEQEEIMIGDYEPGAVNRVTLHDGSVIKLRKLEEDYDPADRMGALNRLELARQKREFITGLIHFDDSRRSLTEVYGLGDTPLAELPEEKLRPSREALAQVMASFH